MRDGIKNGAIRKNLLSRKKLQNAENALYAESQGQVSKEAAYQRMIEEVKSRKTDSNCILV